MRIIKKILSYMIKNIWRLLLPVVPSALLLGFFYEPAISLTFIKEYAVTGIDSIADVFALIFSTEWAYYVFGLPAFFVIMVASGSYLLSMVYKHFRTGKISVRTPFVNMNHSVGAIMFAIICLFVVMLIYKFLFSCLVSLISMITAKTSVPGAAEITLSCLLGIATYFPVTYLLMYPVLTSSVMLVYGYRFNEAFSFAIQLRDKPKFYEVELAFMFPIVINAIGSYLLTFLGMPDFINVPIQMVVNTFVLSYFVVFSITVVFDLLQFERLDTRKLY